MSVKVNSCFLRNLAKRCESERSHPQNHFLKNIYYSENILAGCTYAPQPSAGLCCQAAELCPILTCPLSHLGDFGFPSKQHNVYQVWAMVTRTKTLSVLPICVFLLLFRLPVTELIMNPSERRNNSL